MAVRIPIYLINRTGPEWKKFEDQAVNAGLNAQKAADSAIKSIAQSNQRELTNSIKNAEDHSFRLSRTVKALNQVNLVPRGYEMFAFRTARLVEGITQIATSSPQAAAAVGTLVAAFGSLAAVLAAVNEGQQAGIDYAIPGYEKMIEQTKRLNREWEYMRITLAENSVVKWAADSGVSLDAFKTGFAIMVRDISEGGIRARLAWEWITGGALNSSLVDLIKKSDELAEVDRIRGERVKAAKISDELNKEIASRQKLKAISKEEYESLLNSLLVKKQDQLVNQTPLIQDEEKRAAEQKRLSAEITAIQERFLELQEEEVKIQEKLKSLREERARGDDKEIDDLNEINRLIAEQERIAEDAALTNKVQEEALKRIEDLDRRRLQILRDQKREQEKLAADQVKFQKKVDDHYADRGFQIQLGRDPSLQTLIDARKQERDIVDDVNKKHEERETALKRMVDLTQQIEAIDKRIYEFRKRAGEEEESRRFRERQARQQELMNTLGQNGGQQSISQMLGGQDVRNVRRNFIQNRMDDERRRLEMSGQWGQMTQEEQARAMRTARGGAQRDWRQGNQSEPGELARAQADTALQHADTLARQGQITAQQQQVFHQIVNQLQQQQAEQERQSQDLRDVQSTLNSMNNNQRRRSQSGARN